MLFQFVAGCREKNHLFLDPPYGCDASSKSNLGEQDERRVGKGVERTVYIPHRSWRRLLERIHQ